MLFRLQKVDHTNVRYEQTSSMPSLQNDKIIGQLFRNLRNYQLLTIRALVDEFPHVRSVTIRLLQKNSNITNCIRVIQQNC